MKLSSICPFVFLASIYLIESSDNNSSSIRGNNLKPQPEQARSFSAFTLVAGLNDDSPKENQEKRLLSDPITVVRAGFGTRIRGTYADIDGDVDGHIDGDFDGYVDGDNDHYYGYDGDGYVDGDSDFDGYIDGYVDGDVDGVW